MIWLPITVGVLLRLIQLWMPIVGVHSWRQADTAAMARHFALSDTPIWLPQIDWAGAAEGYVESEFPLFPFLVGRLYQLFGIQEWLGRGLALLCSALTIWLVIRLGRRWFGPQAGWWGGLFFAIAPLGVSPGRTSVDSGSTGGCDSSPGSSPASWRLASLPTGASTSKKISSPSSTSAP